jgi:hypothetical protein
VVARRGALVAAWLGAQWRDDRQAAGLLRAVRWMARAAGLERLAARRLAEHPDDRRTAAHRRLAAEHAALGAGPAQVCSVPLADGLVAPGALAALGAQALSPPAVAVVSDAQALALLAVAARGDVRAVRPPAAGEPPGAAVAARRAEAAQHGAPEAAVLPDAAPAARAVVDAAPRRVAVHQHPAVAAGPPAADRAGVASAVHPGRLRPAPAPPRAERSAPAIRSLPFASPTERSSQAAQGEV